MAKWSKAGNLSFLDPRALQSYRQSCNEPSRIHAFCEDYRAGATCDVDAGRGGPRGGPARSLCPVQVIWSEFYLTGGAAPETPLAVWRRTFAPEAVGTGVASGHFVAEENAPATLAALQAFLSGA